MKAVASVLKGLRAENKLSQSEMAKLFKCHVQFISNVERGTCPMPVTWIPKLARKFQVPAEAFVDAMVFDYHDRLKKRLRGSR